MDAPSSKKSRPTIDLSQLSPSDREAFERVASMLKTPVDELWGSGKSDAGLGIETTVPAAHQFPTQGTGTNDWHNGRGNFEMNNFISYPHAPGSYFPAPGRIGESCDDPSFIVQTEPHPQTFHMDSPHHAEDATNFGNMYMQNPWPDLRRFSLPNGSSSVDTIPEQSWQIGNDVILDGHSGSAHETPPSQPSADAATTPLNIIDYNPHIANGTKIHGSSSSGPMPPPARPSSRANDRVIIYQNDPTLVDSDEDEQSFEVDAWENVQHTPSSSSSTNSSGWSLIESPRNDRQFQPAGTAKSDFKWISPNQVSEASSLRRRRGPFLDKKLQAETSDTRKRKACVRCRMQKTRCLGNPSDPDGECMTCQAVSKQKIHTLPCLRYKITECVLYRTGKAPGMEFTLRWPEMKLKDISEWANSETRTISIKSDMCPIPLVLHVRKFIPTTQDSLEKGWMDGKVKKFKEVTPFAIVNMNVALKEMREHINNHVFRCMAAFIDGRDALVQETYAFARKYMVNAPLDEQRLLGNFFRLWFAIRRTATTEFIVSEDTIDMLPETKDKSYPLFGKIPLPPVMIHQLDMIITLGLLQPLRKKVLEDFHKIVVANKPKSWMTIYLITFMFLHRSATLSAENYQNARKHGLRRRYAIPTFISELHHGSNVFLSHYHYCTKPCDPFTMDWKKRQSTPFAEMSTDEIHFLVRTSELVKERKEKFRVANAIDLYEDDLYFIAQMFDQDWVPRDTVIDFEEGTVADVPLQRYFNPKK